jgi:phage virion morphogenesis protein
MSGVLHEVTLDVRQTADALSRLASLDRDALMFEVGQLVEDQTRRRIIDEKVSPDGTRWAPWSRRYAATRGNEHSLLVGEGNPGLLESITNHTADETAKVGSNLVYAATHQMGRGGIPARPYLGVSDANRLEIEDLVIGRVEELLQ